MKVALLLRGMTYKDFYVHHTGKILKVDYRENLDKIKEQIINPLKQKYDTDVYLATHSSSLDKNDIIKDFDPLVDYDFIYQEGLTQTDNLLAGLRLIYRQGENKYFPKKYDFIIVLRLDIDLLMNINDIKYDVNKFNFLWNEITKDGQVGDCMFFFHSKFLLSFINALNEYTKTKYTKSLHFIRPYIEKFIDKTNINIIFSEYYDSNTDYRSNPVYKIIRIEGEILPQNKNIPAYYNKFHFNPIKFGLR